MSATRALLASGLILLVGGCDMARFYMEQTEGISPAKLVPLYFQEKQYVQDRTLAAKVRGALAAEPALSGADIGVEVYKSEVLLTGRATPQQALHAVETTKHVFGVESVTAKFR